MLSTRDAPTMRPIILLAALLAAALVAAPVAGASCHYCIFPEPVNEAIRGLLP